MPIACRNVEPTHLGICEVPRNEDDEKKCVLSTVANNAVVGLLLQLSSFVRLADDLFCDISDESLKVFERIDILSKRIHGLNTTIKKLDAKQVTIPEGDLKQFTAVTRHHQARHGYDAALFVPTNRPQCIRDQYNLCTPNPTQVIRSADVYRNDGLNGSKMFKCWPIITNDQCIRTPDLNVSRKVQRVRSFEKKKKTPKMRERPKTIHGWDDFIVEDIKHEIEEGKKIHMDKCHLPVVTPEVVSINVSGANFEQMSLRSSSRKANSYKGTTKKKKRRQTVAGIENVLHDLEKFEGRKKITEGGARHTPRSYSFDDLDTDIDDNLKRDEEIAKYLDELGGKMEGKTGEVAAKKIMKFFPCHRSRSLPRCMKITFLSRSLSAERKSQKDLSTSYVSSSLSVASLASSVSRFSRSSKKSNKIGNKIKSFVSGNIKERPKSRPKSLDIDTILDSKHSTRTLIEEHERSKSICNLERNHTQNLLDNLTSKVDVKASNSTIGPGSYYSFESSTLPKDQAKKYDFPWESLPKDWTTSVKLREISKKRSKKDRQSSSGNWSQSGSSSNRQSLDSDLLSDTFKFTSQYSLGKDSGRDSLTLEEANDCVTDGTSTAGYAADGTSTITGDSVSIGNPKTDFTDLETEAWIKCLAARAASQEEVYGNVDKSSTLSRLTRQNILALDLMLSDEKPQTICDEDSSVYSVDQEGFYTSFHKDSALKRSTHEDTISKTKDSLSNFSVESVIHNPLGNDKFAGLKKASGITPTKVLNKVTPPTPPVRSSSCVACELRSQDNVIQPPQLYSYPSQDLSVAGSDTEAVLSQILDETNLASTTGFPSLGTLLTSDNENSPDNTSHQLKNSKNHKHDLEHLAIKDTSQVSCFSINNNSVLDSSKSDPSLIAPISLTSQFKSALEYTTQSYDSYTLSVNKNCKNKSEFNYQSWPRLYKGPPTSGILKTAEKHLDGVRTLKTLNFAPVVNLFNEGAKSSVEVPLPLPTYSTSSVSINPSSLFSSFQPWDTSQEKNFGLVPIDETSNSQNRKTCSSLLAPLPLKYQPVITVTPRSRSSAQNISSKNMSRSLGQIFESNNRTDLCTSSSVKPVVQSTLQYSINSTSKRQISNQTTPSLYSLMAPKDPSRQNSLKSAGSSSSLSSSGNGCVNNGATHMITSSPCSTPNLSTTNISMSITSAGSVDSLINMHKNPTNKLENDIFTIHANCNDSKGKIYKDDKSRKHDNISVVMPTNARNDIDSIQNGGHQSSANLGSLDYVRDKLTPNRWTLDSTECDLARVTNMLLESTMGSAITPASRQSLTKNAGDKRQIDRQRSDIRNEHLYRNSNTSNRRSLPSNGVQTRSDPMTDTRQGPYQNNQTLQKTMSSSKSYPLGFNSILLSNSNYISEHIGVNTSNQTDTRSSMSNFPGSSLNGEQFSSRSDSYRIAMGNAKHSRQSHSAMPQSKSFPVFPATRYMSPNRALNQIEDDVMSRADSYRVAVRNTNGISPDFSNHYISYGGSITDNNSFIVTAKHNALALENIKSTSDKNLRKTRNSNVDHVKELTAKPPTNDATIIHSQVYLRNKGGKTNSNMVSLMKDSHERMSSQTEGGRIRKVTTHDVDPIEVVQTVDCNSNNKKLDKNSQNRSSTYIQFDPIFEDTEDLSNITDLDMSSLDYCTNLLNISKSQFGLINGIMNDGSVKVMKKSKSGENIEIEDDYRFSQV